jgi:hypothetical protein
VNTAALKRPLPHDSVWRSPAPLWRAAGAADDEGGARPALLRFADDDFMARLLALLAAPGGDGSADDAARGEALAQLLARPESWRDGLPAAPQAAPLAPLAERLRLRRPALRAGGSPPTLALPAREPRQPLKLFQPAHQRYYLVGASLVCRLPGLPDRAVDAGQRQSVGFVLRRLLPPAGASGLLFRPDLGGAAEEHAFLPGPAGARWQRLPPGREAVLAEGEEVLPLFPMGYREQGGLPRRLWAGLVPVGRREQYLGAAESTAPGTPAPATPRAADDDPRLTVFRKTVSGPWRQLVERAQAHACTCETDPQFTGDLASAERARKQLREALQVGAWLTLADFAGFLERSLPAVWQAVQSAADGQPTGALPPASARLLAALLAARTGDALDDGLTAMLNGPAVAPAHLRDGYERPRRLVEALVRAHAALPLLESRSDVFTLLDRKGWPDWLFPLADGQWPGAAPWPVTAADRTAEFDALPPDRQGFFALNLLVDRVAEALPEAAPAPAQPMPTVQAPTRPEVDGWFVIRCVYRQPACEPAHGPTVSPPTQVFQLAGFFDPDAPARPIRIGLPVDTTPAGLRKFDKNTAFVMSDILCGQVQRAKGLGLSDLVRSVLPFPLHKDLDVGSMQRCSGNDARQIGMICSLSIPIITLCALILLMIMVSLLDMIFRWIPWFAVCFPVRRKP